MKQKICKRGCGDWVQIINAQGDVRLCSWAENNVVGNLVDSDILTILKDKKASAFYETMLDGKYVNCKADQCPYLANGTMDEILIETPEPGTFPSTVLLAYEGVCNYNCTCCTSFDHMADTKKNDYSREYELLEERIKEFLPYAREISANGRGELFCSKHIMKLLSEYESKVPADEVKISLETNGALFNEKNWKKIENLGQYYLDVVVTVMSFNERDYQYLSGTSLPIDNIINNLYFLKSLREKNIINEFKIATVVQEYNFREMPEFTRRAIEEFGVDLVRLRSIVPGGRLDEDAQWFANVRNPLHPYFHEYKDVMKHPIFKHPKVWLWSGELNDDPLPSPYKKEKYDVEIMNRLIYKREELIHKIKEAMKENDVSDIALYGLGILGRLFIELYQDRISVGNIYDKWPSCSIYKGIPVHGSNSEKLKAEKVVVLSQRAKDIVEVKKDLETKTNQDVIYILLDDGGNC